MGKEHRGGGKTNLGWWACATYAQGHLPNSLVVYGGRRDISESLRGWSMKFSWLLKGHELKMSEQCHINDFMLPQQRFATPGEG